MALAATGATPIIGGNNQKQERKDGNMPKLPKKVAKRVEDTESSEFPLIPDGKYVGVLKEVLVSDEPGDSGSHYWMWVFEKANEEDVERTMNEAWTAGTLRNITSLSEKADFKMKEAFAAFNVPADTDTDELLGQRVLLVVGHGPIRKGPRKGDITNSINKVLPWDGEGGGADSDEDEF